MKDVLRVHFSEKVFALYKLKFSSFLCKLITCFFAVLPSISKNTHFNVQTEHVSYLRLTDYFWSIHRPNTTLTI